MDATWRQDDRLHGRGFAHHDHGHSHDHKHDHDHRHGVIDRSIASLARGLWAVKWSFIGLVTTALFQVVVVAASGSVALLADDSQFRRCRDCHSARHRLSIRAQAPKQTFYLRI